MYEMALENYFLSPEWIWAGIALLPLIILYFLRPRPQKQTIPSLMFLLRDKKKKRLRGFLQKFIPNILLLLQAFIIIALALALLRPYIDVPLSQSAQQTIIVLDDSASMHVRDADGVRYEKAVQELSGLIGKSNTVILAGSSAQIVLEEASASDTQEYLARWKPSHQPTHLRVALQEAVSRADEDTAVLIASDFIDTEPQSSPQEALAALQSQAGDVQEVRVGTTNTNNIGIIDVQASDLRTTITVKNFDTQTRQTTACVAGVCKEFSLQEQESQQWTFSTPPGVSEILLDTNDAFPIDDRIYIGSEEQNTLDVLVVTNGEWQEHPLSQVLEALDETSVLSIQTTINRPPQLISPDHDLIIFSEINPQFVVERTLRDAEKRVREGAASIVVYQEGMFGIPYGSLLPVEYESQAGATAVLNTNTQRQLVGIQYGSTPEHYIVNEAEQSAVLARSSNEDALVTITQLDAGKTMYYGLPATASFSTSPDYPLFWKNTLDILLNRLSASQRTRDTGMTLTSATEMQTPTGESISGTIRLTHTGAYRSEQTTIVANLNNARESAISVSSRNSQPTALALETENTQPQEYTQEILLLALLLLCVEILYLKYRGDL
jgi:hypothetical protein